MRDYEPQEWEKAVEFDKELRRDGDWVGAKGPVFLHRSGVPLGEATLGDDQTIDMFANECEGMCGL